MARLPRFVIPGQPQYVIVRGNNREAIFYAEADYQFYLDKLKQTCEKQACEPDTIGSATLKQAVHYAF